MQTIEEIRRANLDLLLSEGRTKADIARALRKDPRQVGQWFGKGTAREMSSATARDLELAIGKPRGWLDNIHSVTADTPVNHLVRFDPVTVSDALGTLRFFIPAFDQHGEVDLFMRAYRCLAGDLAISREALTADIQRHVAQRGVKDEGEAKGGRGNPKRG